MARYAVASLVMLVWYGWDMEEKEKWEVGERIVLYLFSHKISSARLHKELCVLSRNCDNPST